MLKIEHLTKIYGDKKAVDDLSLHIRPGEIYGFIGHNGAGKTTTLKSVVGIQQFDSGRITIGGHSIQDEPIACKKMLAYIPDNPDLYEFMTGIQYLNFIADIFGVEESARQERIRKYADLFELTTDLAQPVAAYSHGMKQKLAIISAWIHAPKLIIMDEPTTALTRKEVQALFRVILQLKEQGIAILFVSHKLDEVFEISERFTVFRSGKLTATGNTAELDNKKFTYYMTGREFEEKTFQPSGLSDEPLLEVRNLALPGSYEDISFSLRGGEILGVTGLLDSGRTELALSLFGIRPAQSGEIRIHGKPTVIKSPRAAIENGIGFVPEDRLGMGLVGSMGMTGNMMLRSWRKGSSIFLDRKDPEALANRIWQELEVVTPSTSFPVRRMSGGNVQKVLVGREIAQQPSVLMTAYAVRGLDINTSYTIYNLLTEQKMKGVAVVYVGEDLDVLLELCDRILVLSSHTAFGPYCVDACTPNEIGKIMLQGENAHE